MEAPNKARISTGQAYTPRIEKLTIPYILAYKPTIFGSILTFKLRGSAYSRVMPHSQSQHDGYQSATLNVCVPHGVDH